MGRKHQSSHRCLKPVVGPPLYPDKSNTRVISRSFSRHRRVALAAAEGDVGRRGSQGGRDQPSIRAVIDFYSVPTTMLLRHCDAFLKYRPPGPALAVPGLLTAFLGSGFLLRLLSPCFYSPCCPCSPRSCSLCSSPVCASLDLLTSWLWFPSVLFHDEELKWANRFGLSLCFLPLFFVGALFFRPSQHLCGPEPFRSLFHRDE